MMEIEIRAKIQNFDSVKDKLNEIKAEFIKKEKQVDYIFGRTKDLDQEHKIIEGFFSARIREKDNKRSIDFKEIKRDGIGSEFNLILNNLEAGINFLKKLDFEKAFILSKNREVYKYKDFEICLDDVEKLGFFIEIEHSSENNENHKKILKECENLLQIIEPEAVIERKKYGDLMQELINE